MPQIPALLKPWPQESEIEEYDVIFIPNDNSQTNQLNGVNNMGDDLTYTYDDGSTYTYHDDGSVTVIDATGETYAGINQITPDGSAVVTVTDTKTGNQTQTKTNITTGQATKVTTGLDVNGIVGIINSVTKVVQAVKGTGNIAGSNIFSQPIGTAIPQANGTVITRNANGTITTYDPRTGQTSTTTLPGQAGGLGSLFQGNNLLIIGALAIGAIALSKRK